MNLFDGICGKVAPGLCRLSMNGKIAVKTRAGYRTWDPGKKKLTNCDNFVLDIGEDFFFVMPARRVSPGDIILIGGIPKCVISAEGDTVTAVNFETATVETSVAERHMFMGNTYFYGKIVSLFGKNGVRGKAGTGRMLKYMMLSSMMKGKEGGASALLPLMLMGGKGDFMEDLFEDDGEDGDDPDMEEPEDGEED